MNTSGHKILERFKRRWQLLECLEVCMYALGSAILIYGVFAHLFHAFLAFILTFVFALFFKRPWKTTLKKVSAYIDEHLVSAEYSTGLLLRPEEELSDLAKLQRHKIFKELKERLRSFHPPHNTKIAGALLGICILLGFLMLKFNIGEQFRGKQTPNIQEDAILFIPVDSSATKESKIPRLEDQSVSVKYPDYTQKAAYKSSKMDIRAIEGARLSWRIRFDTEVKNVFLESNGKQYPMQWTGEVYTHTKIVQHSGFYNFKFISVTGTSYVSDLYALEAIKDKAPIIEIPSLKQFTSFSMEESKKLPFRVKIKDDYGIESANIIATVSKGSGESVKFREEKLNFENGFVPGVKITDLTKTLDLEGLQMEPGDELYFYIEATDRKKPKANRSRSETFFAVIKDTVSDYFEVEGTFGVDQLPDYFRSQRQLIIDTEKLIKERPKLTAKEFKFKSNELGFDQKALRLRYAEFMGEETESDLDVPEDENHEEGGEDEDPLAAYTHDHDNENEHNLVEEEKKEKNKNPLEAYVHDHDNPEESTLFTESLKSKLRQALNEMWDAELQLRLYKPEESLPYQYRALKWIQDIKNSARIYVHRIGFDPPPIKEDKRLSGKIEAITNFQKNENITIERLYPAIREAMERIAILRQEKGAPNERDRLLFEKAGNELAIKAIEAPGSYLKTLQQLKQLTETRPITMDFLSEVQRGLFVALPEWDANPGREQLSLDQLNSLFLKELEIHD